MFQVCIRELLGSNLGQGTGYHEIFGGPSNKVTIAFLLGQCRFPVHDF
jgi:hypothetical protein